MDKNTPTPPPANTEIVFVIKDEPVLEMIHNEFKGKTYTLTVSPNGKYTLIKLKVNVIIPELPDDMVMLDGSECLFEYLRYY
ncbi:hypothetical protein ACFFVB_18335 [Formosa undariae]|uniref:Uncharacterized protein n=1 Tax=Formosa undariae TaxID=1325436 RepID=A0ABV5F6G4_9FLAO